MAIDNPKTKRTETQFRKFSYLLETRILTESFLLELIQVVILFSQLEVTTSLGYSVVCICDQLEILWTRLNLISRFVCVLILG